VLSSTTALAPWRLRISSQAVTANFQELVSRQPSKLPIVEVLRDAIRQRLLPPGTILVQKALADGFGVSRIPVREALQNLTAEGLVTFLDEGGWQVTSLTPDEIDELYSLRLLIEPSLSDAIASRVGPADMSRLESFVRIMDATETSMENWADANYQFHDALNLASGKAHFHRLARQLLSLVEPYSRVAVFHLAGREQSQREHHEIISAITNRNPDRLKQLLTNHLSRAREDLLDYVGARIDESADAFATSQAAREFATRFLDRTSAET
jgi:DNA-binding GntR family transcriptional regulator